MTELANGTALKCSTHRPFWVKSLLALIALTLLALAAAVYAQGLGKLIVQKAVRGPSGYPALTNLNFPINVSCQPGASSKTQIINNGAGTGTTNFYLSVGANCTVTELSQAPFPASVLNFCQAQSGGTPLWLGAAYSVNGGTPSSVPPTVKIAGPAAKTTTVVVTNSWRCLPGKQSQMRVRKIVEGPSGAPSLVGLGFGANVACSPAVTPANVTVLANSGNVGFAPFIGANCTITEAPPPAFPLAVTGYCASKGGQPVWDPPIYTPNGTTAPPTVSIGATPVTIAITNRWRCMPVPKSKLEVIKQVTGPPGAPALKGLDFGVGANCNPAITPFSQLIEYGSDDNSATFIVPTGASCAVAEGTPLPSLPGAAQRFCPTGWTATWNAPVYTPSGTTAPPTVTVGAAGAAVTITNNWYCAPPPDGQINLSKVVRGPTANLPAMTFMINATCTPAASAASLPISSTAGGSFTAPAGASCTLTEVPPAVTIAMQTACGPTATAVWDSVLAQTFTVVSGPQTRTITNTWKCAPLPDGQINLIKVVQGPTNNLPAMAFTISAACTPAASAATVAISTTTGGSFTAPPGATCTLTEEPPQVTGAMQAACGIYATAAWDPLPAQSLTVVGGMQTRTFTNKWKCVNPPTVPFQIIKLYNGPIGSQDPVYPGLYMHPATFTFSANCTNGASTTFQISPIYLGAPAVYPLVPMPTGTTCTLTETGKPPFAPHAANYCNTNWPGSTPVWIPPTFSVPQPMTIGANSPNSVYVVNNWSCSYPSMPYMTLAPYHTFPASNISISKQVVGPAASLINSTTFTVNYTCSSGYNGTVTLNHYSGSIWQGLYVAIVGDSGPYSCTFIEDPPQVVPAMNNFCSNNGQSNSVAMWDPPLYPGGQTRVANGQAQNVHIVNSWHCAPSTQRVAPPKKPSRFRIRLKLPIPGIGGGGGDREKDDRPPPPDSGRP